jgi:hypothetical protein
VDEKVVWESCSFWRVSLEDDDVISENGAEFLFETGFGLD